MTRRAAAKRESPSALVGLIWSAYARGHRLLEERLRANHVTPSQLGILNRLADRPGLSGAEIARSLQVTPQAAHLALSELERKGFIARTRSGPGLVVRSELTDAGCEVRELCNGEYLELAQRLVSVLSTDEQGILAELLQRYIDHAGEHAPGPDEYQAP